MMDLKQHKTTVYSTVFLLLFSLLFSCTVTKRHFGSGYHVEWKKNFGKEKTFESKQSEIALREELTTHQEELDQGLVVIPEVHTPEDKSRNESESIQIEAQKQLESIEKPKLIDSEKIRNPETIQQVEPELTSEQPRDEIKGAPKKTEPLTWVALTFVLGLGLSCLLIALFSSFMYLGAGIFLTSLVMLAFIFSLISFIRVYKNPTQFKNKALTKVLFFLSSVCLIVGVVYFLFVVAMDSMGEIM